MDKITTEEAIKWLDEHCTGYVMPLTVKVACLEALEEKYERESSPCFDCGDKGERCNRCIYGGGI